MKTFFLTFYVLGLSQLQQEGVTLVVESLQLYMLFFFE